MAEPGLSRIEQIAMPVRDLDRAVQFYQTFLGMKFLFQVPGLAFFDCAGVRLMLSVPEGPGLTHPGSVLYFKVDDIHAAFRSFGERGVRFSDEPHMIADMGNYEIWMAFFEDSEGNPLAISGEIPHRDTR